MKAFYSRTQTAAQTPMVDTTLGQTVEQAVNTAANQTIYPIACLYNGNANVGRFLEFYVGIGSDVAPFILPANGKLEYVNLGTINSAGDCTIGFFRNGDVAPFYTITILDTFDRTVDPSVNFSLLQGDEIHIKVTAGSRSKPFLRFFINSGAIV